MATAPACDVAASFRYRSANWEKAVQENPTIAINPIANMVEDYTLEFMELHGKGSSMVISKQLKERVLDWIRADPKKMARVEEAYEHYQAAYEAHLQIVDVTVKDGRLLEISGQAGLDKTGFTLHQHQSRVCDWNDEVQVQRLYYPEISQKVKQLVGATMVFCNDHSIRQTENTAGETAMDPLGLGMKNPISLVHNDFTCDYAESLARALELEDPSAARIATFNLLEKLKAAGITPEDLRSKYRVIVVNAWRNCSDQPLDTMPLAMCDSRSVGHHGELTNTLAQIKGGYLETVACMPCSDHEWYWYDSMTRDEVLLFKTFDSAKKSSRGQIHSAFQPIGSKPCRGRHSCEARVLCLVDRPMARL